MVEKNWQHHNWDIKFVSWTVHEDQYYLWSNYLIEDKVLNNSKARKHQTTMKLYLQGAQFCEM